jgi:hypothetical protein
MKIFLQNDKDWSIHPDTLSEQFIAKYIQKVQCIKRIYSEESILDIFDDKIKKMVSKDIPIEYGKIVQHMHYNYYKLNDGEPSDGEPSDGEPSDAAVEEINIVLDRSVISYQDVYRIPPQHVVEHITKYYISLTKKSATQMVIEIVNNNSHDLYFTVSHKDITADICGELLQLLQLVKS